MYRAGYRAKFLSLWLLHFQDSGGHTGKFVFRALKFYATAFGKKFVVPVFKFTNTPHAAAHAFARP